MTEIVIYEEYEIGTSIDVLKERAGKNRPIGIASVSFDEATGGSIYYTIDSVIYFDTVRVTVIDKFQRWNYCIYRIDENHLIYDPLASERKKLAKGRITEIRFLNEREDVEYSFYSGEEYKGKI